MSEKQYYVHELGIRVLPCGIYHSASGTTALMEDELQASGSSLPPHIAEATIARWKQLREYPDADETLELFAMAEREGWQILCEPVDEEWFTWNSDDDAIEKDESVRERRYPSPLAALRGARDATAKKE